MTRLCKFSLFNRLINIELHARALICVQDLIVLMCFHCLHFGLSSFCTAVAASWQGITHSFITTIRESIGPTFPSSASVPPAYPQLAPSLLAATLEPALPDPILAESSSSYITGSTTGAMGALAQLTSCLIKQNSLLTHRLQLPTV